MIYDNGLESVEPGSTAWIDIVNANAESTFTGVADCEFTNDTDGVILQDRANSNKYRLYVNNGTLSIELVV